MGQSNHESLGVENIPLLESGREVKKGQRGDVLALMIKGPPAKECGSLPKLEEARKQILL